MAIFLSFQGTCPFNINMPALFVHLTVLQNVMLLIMKESKVCSCSSDGFCSVVTFEPGELGEEIKPSSSVPSPSILPSSLPRYVQRMYEV